jgi:hypothetical protein
VHPPQLTHEQDPQQDVLPDELEPLVAPVSDSIIDSETSITSIASISSSNPVTPSKVISDISLNPPFLSNPPKNNTNILKTVNYVCNIFTLILQKC